MQVGDLVKFIETGVTVVYLGLVNDFHQFHDIKYGIIELWKKRFDINKVEIVSESR